MTTTAAGKKKSRFSPLIRIIAAVLAVIMITSVVLYQNSGVTLNVEQFEEKGSRVAARELLREDEYANASRFEQMTAFARNLLSGKHTTEDLELGIQISISRANYDDAIALSKQMLDNFDGTDQELGRICLRLGYLYIMKKDEDNAIKWLNEGIARTPTPEAYLARAQVSLIKGDTEAALADVDICNRMSGDSVDLLPDMVNIYDAAGQFEKAAEMYTRLIDKTGEKEYLLNRAYCMTNLGKLPEAAADRDLYAEANGKELASADVMIGVGWMRSGEYAKAGESFARAIEEGYANPESVYYYVVLCGYVNGDFERVCTYGDQLIERISQGGESGAADITMEKTTGRLNVSLVEMDRVSLYLMTGASHMRTGEYSKATECLTACLKEDKDLYYAYYLRGTCLLAAKQYREAIADFDVSIAAGEEVENSRYGRGVSRMQLGENDGAIEDFEWVVLHGEDSNLFEESSALIQKLLDTQEGQAEAKTEINGEQ